MPVNTQLVNVVSPTIHVLKDTIEYPWQVGCSATAVGMVVGYWDRHGFANLIDGDSSTYSSNVMNAIASSGHYTDYYNFAGYSTLIPDASSSGAATHADDSIADFLYSSRSVVGLGDGWTFYGFEGIGLHGYATSRGYEDFKTTHKNWGAFNFTNISNEIDAGHPVILSVDASGDGINDHDIVAFGYNSATKQLLIHDGWASTSNMTWIDFVPATAGHAFGITSATFVTPPASATTIHGPEFMHFTPDGSGSASSYSDVLFGSGKFSKTLMSSDCGINYSRTLGITTTDGHTLYQLYNDGAGSAALYKILAYGDGNFGWILLNSDCHLSLATIDFATADNHTFYQLLNDGVGTAALYQTTLQTDGTFKWSLMNADCGLSQKTVGFTTLDGKTFYGAVDDGSGTAATYRDVLQSNGTFKATLLSNDSGLDRNMIGMVEWQAHDAASSPTTNLYYNVSGTTQNLTGATSADTFVIAGKSADFGWGTTADGKGYVVGHGSDVDLLTDFETIRFADRSVTLTHPTKMSPTAPNTALDDPNISQNLTGGSSTDTFVIAGKSADYHWDATLDGKGTVIWGSEGFDILNQFETIKFADATLDLHSGALTRTGAKLRVADIPTEAQHLTGTAGIDTFVIAGASKDYGWSHTADGTGYAVWKGAAFDVLTGFEKLQFNDKVVDLL